ncbi:MAG TPA: response regulator transcription factor [Candidatus Baltobacteraceae bacterium]|jgi:DNA-binding NarL/FixJ family response regulator|nr:response regulator transcription factor [Candidatus Baltobacteraceae bacterium]
MQGAERLRGSVRVLVAEASFLHCQMVENIFRPKRTGIVIVASSLDYRDTLAQIKEYAPDVAVISARLREGPLEGYRVLRELHLLRSKTRAVMLLDSRDRDLVVDAFRCGARGLVFRDEPIETLGKCIHVVHRGQVWANSENLGHLLEAFGKAMPFRFDDSNGASLLTKRERDVARLVADGLTNREVSKQLGLSEHTVRNYLLRVFDKLGVSTRVELVLYCLQQRQQVSAPTTM